MGIDIGVYRRYIYCMNNRNITLHELYNELGTYEAVAVLLKCNAANVGKHLQQIDKGDKQVLVELDADGNLVSAKIIKPLKTIQPSTG